MSFTTSTDTEPEILHERNGSLGIATLNRTKALNALTTGMVEDLHKIYTAWDSDPSVALIILKGAGEKAFCAGGDVKTVVQLGQDGRTHDAVRFFRSEYRLNHLISRLKKPHIALIDGITMGGGFGVSIHGDFRVATERTLFAMPECAIGFVPDVGGSYVLPRLPGSLGLYLGLTGARLKGVDVKRAHIATHYIPFKFIGEVEQGLASLSASAAGDKQAVKKFLDEIEAKEALPKGDLADQQPLIDRIFSDANSVEDIYAACERIGGDFAKETINLMSKGSPTSQRLTYELYHRGKAMNLADVLRMEYRVAYNTVKDRKSDFYAGVTAMLITRQGPPTWNPESLDKVKSVENLLSPLPEGEEEPDLDRESPATAKL